MKKEITLDRLIWYVMTGIIGLVTLLGSTWINSVNTKVDENQGRIISMESQLKNLTERQADIRESLKSLWTRGRTR